MPPSSTVFDDPAFIDRLRRGDAAAYRQLIRRFHGSLVGVAASVIGSHAQAEEVVQDAWLAVFSGIGRFEGRAALGTWLFSIVLNRARTRRGREMRLVALPTEPDGATLDPGRFAADGHWLDWPRPWDEFDPERLVAGRQIWDHVQAEIDRLPPGQRAVIILRDIEGQDAPTACELLGITPENQRVLLHRARIRVRDAIDLLVGGGERRVAGDRAAKRQGPEEVKPPLARHRFAILGRFAVASHVTSTLASGAGQRFVRTWFCHETVTRLPRWVLCFRLEPRRSKPMRTIVLRLVTALGVLGAISATASAAPMLNGVDTARGQRSDIVEAAYYWNHHHYDHRHWEHNHWRYY